MVRKGVSTYIPVLLLIVVVIAGGILIFGYTMGWFGRLGGVEHSRINVSIYDANNNIGLLNEKLRVIINISNVMDVPIAYYITIENPSGIIEDNKVQLSPQSEKDIDSEYLLLEQGYWSIKVYVNEIIVNGYTFYVCQNKQEADYKINQIVNIDKSNKIASDRLFTSQIALIISILSIIVSIYLNKTHVHKDGNREG